MAFSSDFPASAWPALAASFGETITWKPAGTGTGTSITALVQRGAIEGRSVDRGALPIFPVEIWITQADAVSLSLGASTATLAQRPGDTGTKVYTVARLLGSAGGIGHLGLI